MISFISFTSSPRHVLCLFLSLNPQRSVSNPAGRRKMAQTKTILKTSKRGRRVSSLKAKQSDGVFSILFFPTTVTYPLEPRRKYVTTREKQSTKYLSSIWTRKRRKNKQNNSITIINPTNILPISWNKPAGGLEPYIYELTPIRNELTRFEHVIR